MNIVRKLENKIMSLFRRKKKDGINHVDLDDDKKIISSTGEIVGKAVDYSSAGELKKLAG